MFEQRGSQMEPAGRGGRIGPWSLDLPTAEGTLRPSYVGPCRPCINCRGPISEWILPKSPNALRCVVCQAAYERGAAVREGATP